MLRRYLESLLQRISPSEKPDRNQWVAISISFVLAVTLWFLVTLNTQDFVSRFEVPVKVVNVSKDVQLSGGYPTSLEVESRGRGIELLNEYFEPSKDTIRIDFQTFRDQEYFIASNNFSVINAALKNDIRAIRVTPDSIPLVFGRRATRRVPLVPNHRLDLPLGFRNVLGFQPDQDSVDVSGPQKKLDTLKFWRTERVNIPVDKAGPIQVPVERRPFFQVIPKIITLPVEPLAYTEKEMRIPVFPANLPADTRLRLTPDSVNVRVLVPVESYETVENSNLFFEVNFEDLDRRSRYAIPYSRNFPDRVILQRFTPIRLEYLIIKEL